MPAYEELLVLLSVLLFSWLFNAALVFSRERVLKLIAREGDHSAVQSAHSVPTPRLGGLGIVIAAVFGILLLPVEETQLKMTFLVSLLPVFLVGLLEDIGGAQSPRRRLLATLASGVLFIAMSGVWINGIGIWGLDYAFALAPVAIVITLLWTTGMPHAFNLIDGVNGLAGATSVLIGAGLAAVAWLAGDTQMALFAGVMMAATTGFQLHNWPKGKIFMGDCGAYSIGHLLVWLGLVIAARNPEVAGISIALFYFWPVADTLWAIYRRMTNQKPTDQPDRMHFHQLVMRTLEIKFGLRGKRHISNSLTSFLLAPLVGVPILLGVVNYKQPYFVLLSLVVLAIVFVASYRTLVGFASRKSHGKDKAAKDQSMASADPVMLDIAAE